MNIFDEIVFTDKEWAILVALFQSSAPLTVDEVKKKSSVNMAWETCEKILEKLSDEKFVEKKELPYKKKKVLWSINYEKKKQLYEKYFKKKE